MLRQNILNGACFFLLLSLVIGTILQIEHLKSGGQILKGSMWSNLLPFHAWLTPLSIVIIVVSTLSFIRHKRTFGIWAIWLGFSLLPLLYGLLTQGLLSNLDKDAFLHDTVYLTANRHAYGVVLLMVALGGLSAFKKMKQERLSLIMAIIFAFPISVSGVVMNIYQARLGFSGMPRRYYDYPDEFASLQFIASLSGMICFTLAAIYVVLMWRRSAKESDKIKEVF